jgi:hypothetical protein
MLPAIVGLKSIPRAQLAEGAKICPDVLHGVPFPLREKFAAVLIWLIVSGALPMFSTVTTSEPSVESVEPVGVGVRKAKLGGSAKSISFTALLP